MNPHSLQLSGSVFTSVHPVPQHWSMPVQPGPPLHIDEVTHLPETHCSPATHLWSHPPQSAGSLVVSTQPLAQHWSLPVQTGPPLQESGAWHMADAQLSPAGHVIVQLPQCAGSTSVFTHRSPQQVSEPEQPPTAQPVVGWHAPPMHGWPAGHARSHVPQWSGSVASSTQPPPQQSRPPVHAPPPPHEGTHCVPSHTSPGGHWLDCVQPTHSPSLVSQMGLLTGHCELRVQPVEAAVHLCVLGLQTSPFGQVSGFVRQATQTPCGSSQNGVAGVAAHCSLEVHPRPGRGPSKAPSMLASNS